MSNFRRVFFLIFVFFLCLNIGFSSKILVTNSERVEVMPLDYGKVSLNALGIINLENPSFNNDIFEFSFLFRNDLIFDVSVNELDSFSDLSLVSGDILGRFIPANSSRGFSYRLSGVLPMVFYQEFLDSNVSLFEWYLKEVYFDPQKFATLNKFDRELRTVRNSSSRMVSVIGSNPTEFEVDIKYINLFKTDSSGYFEFRNQENLLDTFTRNNVLPNENFEFEFEDLTSDDTSVYWIEFKVVSKFLFNSTREIVNITVVSGGGGSGNSDDGGGEWNFLNPLTFTKIADKGSVKFGDRLNISLFVSNPNNYSIKDVSISDSFPDFFELVFNRGVRSVTFDLDYLLPFETKVIDYELEFSKDYDDEIIYFPFARLDYNEDTVVFSNSLNLVNDEIGYEKKLYVEKRITELEGGNVEIRISVKNIGEVDLYDFIVSDSGNFSFDSEVDRFGGYSWRISRLGVNENWEAFYVENSTRYNDYVPDVFGDSTVKVYKTVIKNSEVRSSGVVSKVSTWSLILVAVGFMLFFVDLAY